MQNQYIMFSLDYAGNVWAAENPPLLKILIPFFSFEISDFLTIEQMRADAPEITFSLSDNIFHPHSPFRMFDVWLAMCRP